MSRHPVRRSAGRLSARGSRSPAASGSLTEASRRSRNPIEGTAAPGVRAGSPMPLRSAAEAPALGQEALYEQGRIQSWCRRLGSVLSRCRIKASTSIPGSSCTLTRRPSGQFGLPTRHSRSFAVARFWKRRGRRQQQSDAMVCRFAVGVDQASKVAVEGPGVAPTRGGHGTHGRMRCTPLATEDIAGTSPMLALRLSMLGSALQYVLRG